MVGPQVTEEQQRISQQGLPAAIEADVEVNAGLLANANRAHFDRALAYSERIGISQRDARFAVAADADLEPSDGEEAGPTTTGDRAPPSFKKFAAASQVRALPRPLICVRARLLLVLVQPRSNCLPVLSTHFTDVSGCAALFLACWCPRHLVLFLPLIVILRRNAASTMLRAYGQIWAP